MYQKNALRSDQKIFGNEPEIASKLHTPIFLYNQKNSQKSPLKASKLTSKMLRKVL